MIYTQKYSVIYFLYVPYGAWIWVGVSGDLATFEEEYPVWGVFKVKNTTGANEFYFSDLTGDTKCTMNTLCYY